MSNYTIFRTDFGHDGHHLNKNIDIPSDQLFITHS